MILSKSWVNILLMRIRGYKSKIRKMRNIVRRENCSLGCEVCLAYVDETGSEGSCGLITARELLDRGQFTLARDEMFEIIERYERSRVSHVALVEPGRVNCGFGFDINLLLQLIEQTGATLNGEL